MEVVISENLDIETFAAVESVAVPDDLTLERSRECVQAGFPVCLENALRLMFGNVGKRAVKEAAEKDFVFPIPAAETPKDVWAIYSKYVLAWRHRMGNDATRVIEFQSLKMMESMLCAKCPLHEIINDRLASQKS